MIEKPMNPYAEEDFKSAIRKEFERSDDKNAYGRIQILVGVEWDISTPFLLRC